ncbi:VOC family protein [Streptomyces sp. NPDC060031]|uniref:VOC family protein n=1 Tax=Streptomyces sp. NPDC060031 TaxID=3347043 RepID=UPI0036B52AC6
MFKTYRVSTTLVINTSSAGTGRVTGPGPGADARSGCGSGRGAGVSGRCHAESLLGDEVSGDGRPYWHPVFGVADCDAAVARVTENGGSVQMGPADAEGVGRLAFCLDPSNADFVVLAPARS